MEGSDGKRQEQAPAPATDAATSGCPPPETRILQSPAALAGLRTEPELLYQLVGISPPSPFPPIADYGFLSDCEVTALVAPSGNVEWMCLPRMDSPSVFGAILDRGAGGFRLGPADVVVPAARRYLPGTLVLETSWGTGSGWIVVRDVLLM